MLVLITEIPDSVDFTGPLLEVKYLDGEEWTLPGVTWDRDRGSSWFEAPECGEYLQVCTDELHVGILLDRFWK